MANRSDLPALRDRLDELEFRRAELIRARLNALAEGNSALVFSLGLELSRVDGAIAAVQNTIRLLESSPTADDPPDPTVPPKATPENLVPIVQVSPQEDPIVNQQVLGTAGIPNIELIGPLAPAFDQNPQRDTDQQTIVDITRDADGNITNYSTRNVPIASIQPGRISFDVGEDDPIVAPFTAQDEIDIIIDPRIPVDDPVDLDAQIVQQNLIAVDSPTTPVNDPTTIDLDAQAGVGVGNLGESDASSINAQIDSARRGASIRETKQPLQDGDWRVRLQLGPNSTYFYNDASNSLMAPLLTTQGVLFPYTPRIDIAYTTEYTKYRPTHSNYYHYFYQGSGVGEVNLTCDFTAQDTAEANYLLAVLTFLKAAGKMFYGKDPERGSPPPLLFLTGLGDFQFNNHPVVISQFNYNLPDDVDYIKANAAQINSQLGNLQARRPLNNISGPSWAGSTIRRLLNGLPDGATASNIVGPQTLRANNQLPTYVPTKLSINLQLLPVATRKQVSQQFSLKEYANGNLLREGLW